MGKCDHEISALSGLVFSRQRQYIDLHRPAVQKHFRALVDGGRGGHDVGHRRPPSAGEVF
jgi:hypothetical protein